MKSCKPLKAPKHLKAGQTFGIFKVLCYTGQELIETKNPHYEHVYLIKCTVCRTYKKRRQRYIMNARNNKQRWCRSCSEEQRGITTQSKRKKEEQKCLKTKRPEDRDPIEAQAISGKW